MKKLLVLVLFVFLFTGAAFADDGEVFIVSGDMVKVMTLTPAASGEKFEAIGDDETSFWSKGDEAFLTVGGRELGRYVLVRPYRGGEPGALFLTVDGKNYRMKPVVSASGANYAAEDAPGTELWNKGDTVILIVDGVEYPGYDIWQPFGRIWLPGGGE